MADSFPITISNFPRRSTAGVSTLAAAALLSVATLILGFSMLARMKDSVSWVLHTYDTRSQILALRTLSMDLTARAAAAAAINDPAPLSGIAQDLSEQTATLPRLHSMTSDNPDQRARLAELEPLLNATRSQLSSCSAELRCLPSGSSAREQFLRGIYDHHERAMATLQAMDDEEQALLAGRLAAWSSRFRVMVVALAVSFLSALALIFFNVRLLLREIERRTSSEQLVRQHVNSYRALSGRILELQDAERRRIARELHDSVGQYLAAVKFQLDQLQRFAAGASRELFDETSDLVDRSLAEIRTISHLLHPPLLDELGLYSAARWYVKGFAERSGLQLDFTADDFVDRLHKEVEIALFRVLQEALTNVHRHSGARRVKIDISCKNDMAVLLVKDDGCGIPPDILRRYQDGHGGGIGLAGMRERLTELHGSLTVQSSSAGTELRAAVPTNACKAPQSVPESVELPG